MIHSQTKKKYPNCPFVMPLNASVLDTSIDNGIVDDVINTSLETIDSIIKTVINKSKNVLSHYGDDYYDVLIDRLKTVCYPQTDSYDKIFFRICKQKLKRTVKNYSLNMHLITYRDDNIPYINKEYESIIDWTAIPVSIDITVDDKNSSINLIPKDRNVSDNILSNNILFNNINSDLDPKAYIDNIDKQKIESNILRTRTGNRRFIQRDIAGRYTVDDVKKQDTYALPDIQTDKLMNYKPLHQQIPLNSKTRASAQLIRERLANPYKAHRLRNNPESFKSSLKVNPSIRDIGDNEVSKNNDKYNIFEQAIPKTIFDYKHEMVGFKSSNGILHYSPPNSGKIILDENDKISNNVMFISLCFHLPQNTKGKGILHVTLHSVTFIN